MTARITEFKGDNSYLSNFSPHKIEYRGITYKTVEHAYQAQKAMTARDFRAIVDCETPGEAKRMGREIQMDPDFEKNKVAIMYELIRAKFYYGHESHTWPLWWTLTSTLDAELIEGNTWHDNFWGICSCSHCINFHTEGQSNMLGKTLMKVREEIDRENRR